MSAYEQNQNGDWITLKDAADLLKCSARTIRRRIDAGKIETRIEYQGKQSIRYVRRGDILREAGTIQHHEPNEGITEVVTRGATYDNPMTTIGQVQKVVTGLLWRIALIVAVIIILGGVTTYYLVIGQSNAVKGKIEGIKSELSQGLSQVKGDIVTGSNATREALKADIQEIRADTRAENQTTGKALTEKIEEIRTDSQATGAIIENQGAKIEAQTAEIEELQKQVSNQNAAIVSLMDSIRELIEHEEKPEAPPAATIIPIIQPIQTPEEASGFLGIF